MHGDSNFLLMSYICKTIIKSFNIYYNNSFATAGLRVCSLIFQPVKDVTIEMVQRKQFCRDGTEEVIL